MALTLKTAPPRDSVVVILDNDQPRKVRMRPYDGSGRSTVEVASISDAIDRLSDFTTDCWPDVLLVNGGSANLLPLMAEICRSAGVKMVSESDHAL